MRKLVRGVTRTACVIAVAKDRDTFEPFHHQVINALKMNILQSISLFNYFNSLEIQVNL